MIASSSIQSHPWRWFFGLLGFCVLVGILLVLLLTPVSHTASRFYAKGEEFSFSGIPSLEGGGTWYFDAGWVDTQRNLLYQTDGSNKRVDSIDLTQHLFMATIGGFVGQDPTGGSKKGPDHVLGIASNSVVVSDGDGQIHFINVDDPRFPRQQAVVATGGSNRVDAMAYDPDAHLLAAVNSNDTPPFVTLLDVRTRKLVKRLTFATASALGNIVFDPIARHFLVAFTGQPTSVHPYGAIVELDTHLTIVQTYHIPYLCQPTGVSVADHTVTHQNPVLAIACHTGNPLILQRGEPDALAWTMVKNCNGGDSVVTYANHFIFAEANNLAGSLLVITDMGGTVQQTIRTTKGSHSVTVNPANGDLYVPQTGVGIVTYHLIVPQ